MRALSVRQPWAWAIVTGHKTIENRTWHTQYRGRLAIHAGQRFEASGAEFMTSMGLEIPQNIASGALIGTVDLVDVMNDADDPWAIDGHWHWVLANPRVMRPRPMSGKLGLFSV